MSRSPLAYPLTRGIDGDSGGAADLQTDIMRFMAILALCLVAIFALVQSLPMAPQTNSVDVPDPAPPAPTVQNNAPAAQPVAKPQSENAPQAVTTEAAQALVLTRPTWTPKYTPAPRPAQAAVQPPTSAAAETPTDMTPPAPVTTTRQESLPERTPSPAVDEQEGFTLRFESDLALTRLVASGQVGFYAIDEGRAQRMSVHNSRISFWAASTPNEFHEMETTTVPQPVVDALRRSGGDASAVSFGVTLPAKLQSQLAQLMSDHRGGALVIGANGNLQLEAGG